MGVYHFAGLGKSIGAVTAAFSYLAARKQLPDSATDPLFTLSGEAGEDPSSRGAVEGLVLFTTSEIMNNEIPVGQYRDNQAGMTRGNERGGGSFHRTLKSLLRAELQLLARREVDSSGQHSGPPKPLDLYWCVYERYAPVQAFERAAQVMSAAKTPGRIGKEIWVNLTGGSNIINGALQLAASLTGTPARLYYLLSEDPLCVRHTVDPRKLKTEQDRFWVDLPIVYLYFSPPQWSILDLLVTMDELSLDDLYSFLLEKLPAESIPNQDYLIHTYLRPLAAQRLIVHEQIEKGRHIYRIGEAWQREKRYLSILAAAPNEGTPQSLSALEGQVDWLRHEKLDLA